MTELQEIVNLQITDYLKPKHPIFKIYYIKVSKEKLNEEDDEDGDGYMFDDNDKEIIVEAKTKDEGAYTFEKNGSYGYTGHIFNRNIKKGFDEEFFKEIYNPDTINGLNSIKPLRIRACHLSSLFFIYKIERLA